MEKLLQNKKLFKEAVILAVVVLLVLLVAIFQFGWFQGEEPKAKKNQIDTDFNTHAFEEVKNRKDDYPEINLNGVGKDNPFAP